ncbi:hypothetical protein [Kribbella pittospori]|uniref:hypothetical protein n=1 Tax=Kribbella pittospori TaxID=722689 RepID=UPI001EE07585|nr:hypothetical protein [Kribbella pittospori]
MLTAHSRAEEAEVYPVAAAEAGEKEELREAFVVSRKQYLGEQPGDMTRDPLAQQASNADISGTSELSKDKLQQKV